MAEVVRAATEEEDLEDGGGEVVRAEEVALVADLEALAEEDSPEEVAQAVGNTITNIFHEKLAFHSQAFLKF